MKIVVTGALGHIGSRLIRELPALFRGAEIVMVDDLSTQRYTSLFNLPPKGHYRFIEADILKADLTVMLRGADAVVHMAAITNAEASFDIQQRVEEVNFEGTERVARACLETGTSLIFPSTTSVYGTQEKVVDEACAFEDLQPQSPYAESKLKAEQMLSKFGRSHGLGFVICRLGTIFGASPGMRFHTAVNKFCWQAVIGEPITVWRTALNQRRPYLDLGDAVRAVSFLMKKKIYDGQIYNVVTINTTVKGILDAIAPFVRGKLNIKYVDTRIMNQLSYNVSNERFKKLGFTFKGKLKNSIGETIQWLKASQSGASKKGKR
jgi:UDP-glucose 4-epimerase